MIEKVIGSSPELGGWTEGLGPGSCILAGLDAELTKVASPVPMTEDMEAFWRDYPRKNLDGYLFVRLNILGAGEYWGSNRNGDYFPKKALKEYHKTFHRALVYVNHDHDDPKKAIGKVIYSTYNDAPYAQRVEIIVAINKKNPRARKTVEAIESGKGIKVSMGCRVPFDRCSKCNNIAPTKEEYCEHLKLRMNVVEPDGTLICALNDHPAFFDASDVLIEADTSSGYMGKVAAAIAKAAKAQEEEEVEKEGTIVKPDTSSEEDEKKEPDAMEKAVEESSKDLREAGSALGKGDIDLPEDVLEMLSAFPLEKVLGTSAGMQMPLKPKEVTFIIISQSAGKPKARSLFRDGVEFDECPPDESPSFSLFGDYSDKIESLLMPFLESRSMFPSMACERLAMTEEPVQKKIIIKNASLGAKVAAYKRDICGLDSAKLACLLEVKPRLKRRVTGLYGSHFVKTAHITDARMNVLMAPHLTKGAYDA